LGSIPPHLLQELSAGLTRYFAAGEAGKPISLEVACGISQVGRHSWWTKERKNRRNALLRDLWRRRFPHLEDPWAAAKAMQGLLRRQAIAPEEDQLVCLVMQHGGSMPGLRQLARILLWQSIRDKGHPFLCHDRSVILLDMLLHDPSRLPIRFTDDLRAVADPGAVLTPAQALGLAEHLTGLAIRRQVEVGCKVCDIMPGARAVKVLAWTPPMSPPGYAVRATSPFPKFPRRKVRYSWRLADQAGSERHLNIRAA
jgi:hypothetical protein